MEALGEKAEACTSICCVKPASEWYFTIRIASILTCSVYMYFVLLATACMTRISLLQIGILVCLYSCTSQFDWLYHVSTYLCLYNFHLLTTHGVPALGHPAMDKVNKGNWRGIPRVGIYSGPWEPLPSARWLSSTPRHSRYVIFLSSGKLQEIYRTYPKVHSVKCTYST